MANDGALANVGAGITLDARQGKLWGLLSGDDEGSVTVNGGVTVSYEYRTDLFTVIYGHVRVCQVDDPRIVVSHLEKMGYVVRQLSTRLGDDEK